MDRKVTYFLVGLLVVYVIAMAVLAGFGYTAATVTGWLILAAAFAIMVCVQLPQRRRR